MKNNIRFFFVLVALCMFSLQVSAQLRFNVYSGGYFNVVDYAGYTTPEGGHQFHFLYNGEHINLQNWSVRARVSGPIIPQYGQSVSGLPFPPEKISFRFTHDDGNSPTLAEIGAGTVAIPLVNNGETQLIPRSNAPITYESQHGGSMQFHLYFAISIEGGVYLDQFKNREPYSTIVYGIPLTFTLYSEDGLVLGHQDVVYQLQINQTLSGNPTMEPQYGIEVLGNARDARLELSNLANYVDGAAEMYNDGLKVNSNTGYVIAAKALGADMHAVSGGQATLPVSVVQLQLLPGTAPPPSGGYTTVSLSDSYQVLFSSFSGRDVPQSFHITYRTAGNDERLLGARSGTYTTTVLYQLIPQ